MTFATTPNTGDTGSGFENNYNVNGFAYTTNSTAHYICVNGYSGANPPSLTPTEFYAQNMFTEGSTAPSEYIPWGYKIPILSGGTTTPVYLGEVQSERQIYKMVFDGTENWQLSSDTNIYISIATNRAVAWSTIVSSHFTNSQIQTNGALLWFVNRNVDFDTVEECKTYLQQQYSAGTPVCVWYVLATPTTTTLNEPLRKIGTYADSISNVTQIPTTSGSQTFDVDTTLKPSEVQLAYHGWHEHSDKKYSGGSWT